MQKAEVSFGTGHVGRVEFAKFKRQCTNPKFVADCLAKYQRWRQGVGEYKYSDDPAKNRPMPFSTEALSVVENAAIKMLYKHWQARLETIRERRKCAKK